MSVRDLPENRNDASGPYASERETILNVAETKGVKDDIDDIDVEEGETEEGDEIISFRIYTDKVLDDDGSIDEEQSVGAQVTKMPNVPTAQGAFRQDVQSTLSAIKRHLVGDDQQDEDLPDPEEVDDESTTETQTTDVSVDVEPGNGPGSTIDGQIANHEARIEELEQRIDELEEYVDALEGLQKLMGDDDG